MRDKMIDVLNEVFVEENCPVPTEAVGRIADRLIAEGFGLTYGREKVEAAGLCRVGDKVYELFYNEDEGVTEIDEGVVSEVSGQRIWVGGCFGDNYYHIEDVGKELFLSREDAERYIASPEYLAERVNMVLLLNVSNEAKKELLEKVFRVGQEYIEPESGRSLRLTQKVDADFWKFDVYDRRGEWMHETSAFTPRLALDIMNGELIPAYTHELAKTQEFVDGIIADAKERTGEQPVPRQETLVMD